MDTVSGQHVYEIVCIHTFLPSHADANDMLKVWATQAAAAIRFSNGRISCARVITPTVDTPVQNLISSTYPNIRFEKRTSLDKLEIFCEQTAPFIYLDPCSIIVRPDLISELLDAADAQPILAFDHQTIEGHTAQFSFKFINSGVLCASKTSPLNYDAIKTTRVSQWCPGSDDQLLVHNYCLARGIKYTSPKLTAAGWNACGAFKAPVNNTTSPSTIDYVLSVSALSGGGAKADLLTHGLIAEAENCQPIRLLNFWYNYKPWMQFCPVFETLRSHSDAQFSEACRTKGVESGLQLAPFGSLLFGTLASGVETVIPVGIGWEFVTLNQEIHRSALSEPRKPIASRGALVRVGFGQKLPTGLSANLASQPPENEKFSNYIETLRDTAFLIAPGGESHRHYEAWLFGCVPIVEHTSGLEAKYKGLPIVWTRSNYSDVTESRLSEELKRISEEWKNGHYISRLGTFLRTTAYSATERAAITGDLIRNVAKLSEGKVRVSSVSGGPPVLQSDVSPAKMTVFCAVWSGDPMRWQLLKSHQACLDKQTRPVERIYVFDGGDLAPKWLKGRHFTNLGKYTIYEAFAEAVKNVNTPYVMNLNLDDRLCPDGVRIMEEVLDSGADLVGGEWRIEFSQKDTDAVCSEDTTGMPPPLGQGWPPKPEQGVVRLGSGRGERGTFGPSTAWRRSLHDRLGPYPHKFANGEKVLSVGDAMWWRMIISSGHKCARTPKIIGRYHSHPSEQAEFRPNLQNEHALMKEFFDTWNPSASNATAQ